MAGFESDEFLYKVVGVGGPAAVHFGAKYEQGCCVGVVDVVVGTVLASFCAL